MTSGLRKNASSDNPVDIVWRSGGKAAATATDVASGPHLVDTLHSTVRLVDLLTIESETPAAKGMITVLTGLVDCPFEIKRVYWIHGTRRGEIRGRHAHRRLWQFMVALTGSFEIKISAGKVAETFLLASPGQGLLLGPGYWRTIRSQSHGSLLLVAASEMFDESDYIRSYADFLRFRKGMSSGGVGTFEAPK